MPETLKQPCKLRRLKCLKDFVTLHQKKWGLYWWRADGDFIHPCPLQLFLTLRTHARRTIGAPLQNLRRPKLSMTSFEAIWNQSRPTSPSIPTPRCCCFPTNIHQNCHLTMRTWYVNKSLWFMHWHHYWLSICSSLVIWVMF